MSLKEKLSTHTCLSCVFGILFSLVVYTLVARKTLKAPLKNKEHNSKVNKERKKKASLMFTH